MAGLAGRNVAAGSVPSFLGAGAYRHHIPATVDYLIQRGEFLDRLYAVSAGGQPRARCTTSTSSRPRSRC